MSRPDVKFVVTLPPVPNDGYATIFYVLDGTALNLYADGVQDGPVQLRIILDHDSSFVYQNNRWSASLSSGQLDENLGPFAQLVRRFLAATPPYPDNHVTPQAVIDQFYAYLFNYSIWAQESFQGIADGSVPHVPFFRVVKDAQNELSEFTSDLIH